MTTSTDAPEGSRLEPAGREPSRSRRRTLLGAAVIVIVIIIVLAALSAVVGLGVRANAEAGRVAVSQGRRALASGDLDRALERFREAEARFVASRNQVSTGLGGL